MEAVVLLLVFSFSVSLATSSFSFRLQKLSLQTSFLLHFTQLHTFHGAIQFHQFKYYLNSDISPIFVSYPGHSPGFDSHWLLQRVHWCVKQHVQAIQDMPQI